MRKLLLILPAVTLLICGYTNSFAGNRAGQTTFSLGTGYYHFANKRHLDNGALPNIAFAYNFYDCWAIEAMGGIFNTERKNLDQSVHGYVATVHGIYRFMKFNCFEPYLSAGVGAIGLKPNYNSAVHQGNINAAIGTQVFFYPTIAFRAEAKDIYTIHGGKNDYLLSFGLSFLFDPCCPTSCDSNGCVKA